MTTKPVSVSAYVQRLQAALEQRLQANTIGERHEAEEVIAEILRGTPAKVQPDHKAKAAGKDE